MTRESRISSIRMAMKRMEVGRPKNVGPDRKLSISAVAEEAGLSASTIHTRYPEIAAEIRGRMGLETARDERRSKRVAELEQKVKKLKESLAETKVLLISTASRYADAVSRIAELEAMLDSRATVTPIRGRKRVF